MQHRHKGNPNWGKAAYLHRAPEAAPTAFENEVASLGLLNEGDMLASHQLRIWVRGHMNSRYVPEWLLKEWGMEPSDVSFGI